MGSRGKASIDAACDEIEFGKQSPRGNCALSAYANVMRQIKPKSGRCKQLLRTPKVVVGTNLHLRPRRKHQTKPYFVRAADCMCHVGPRSPGGHRDQHIRKDHRYSHSPDEGRVECNEMRIVKVDYFRPAVFGPYQHFLYTQSPTIHE